jgi:hypothetical protein
MSKANPFQTSSTYAKKFCWRVIDRKEWTEMIMFALRSEIQDHLLEEEVWKHIMENSKVSRIYYFGSICYKNVRPFGLFSDILYFQVSIGKPAARVLEEYKADVLPILEDFIDKDVLGLFNQHAYLNHISSGIEKAVSRRVVSSKSLDPSYYEAALSSLIDIGLLCATKTCKEYAIEYVGRLKANIDSA